MNPGALGLIFILAAITAEAIAQAMLKRAAGHAREGDSQVRSLWRIVLHGWPWAMMGIVFFLVDSSFWTLALQRLAVSLAFPLQSLELVAVAIISSIFLKEKITSRRWLAIALILAGTVLVGA